MLLAAGNDPPPADGSAKPKPTVVSAKTGKVVRQGAGTGAKTKPPAPRSSSKADSPGRRTAARPTRSVPNAVDDYVLPKVVQDIYRDRGYELPRIGAVDSRTAEDIELGRGFAGNINDKLRTLQQDEGIERRGIVDPKLERAAQRPAGLYARLQPLNGPELINELDVV
ncbi:MAG TPA: hypothetical protein VLC93_01455, partial [Myxococcota bacterium]|nr:hypothetical protein [Myxococcota bacterium]